MILEGQQLEARILWEGHGLLAVDKCPDLPTSGRNLGDEDCLQFALMQRHRGMVWAVHQLDADTSGVNLFTTEKHLVEPLKQAMGSADATKSYCAIVHGEPTWEAFECNEPIGYVAPGQLGVSTAGRTAQSRFEVLERHAGHARVQATIATGRTHQIRIHLGSLGHPLVGEEWYRHEPCSLHPRQALHAERMTLPLDPSTPLGSTLHGELDVRAPLPEDLVRLLERLELRATSPRRQPPGAS